MLNLGCTGDIVDLSALFAASFLGALQEVIVVQPRVREVFWVRGVAQDFFLDGGEIASDGCCFCARAEREESVCRHRARCLSSLWKVNLCTPKLDTTS